MVNIFSRFLKIMVLEKFLRILINSNKLLFRYISSYLAVLIFKTLQNSAEIIEENRKNSQSSPLPFLCHLAFSFVQIQL